MRRPLLSLLAAILLMAPVCSSARAWNAAGHMTITKLAWDQLDAKERQALLELLKNHPHWDRFFQAAPKPKGVPDNDYFFALASTWPDWLRGFAKAKTEENKKVYRFHKGPRHYINWSFVHPADVAQFEGKLSGPDPKDDILRGMDTVVDELKASDKFSTKYRAVSLCWLLHLTGDIHQPLHNVALVSAEIPSGDQGGNLFWVKDRGVPTRLHAYWDDLFGREEYDAHGKAYDRAAVACALLSRADFQRDRFVNELKSTKVEDWSKEGLKLAIEVGYRNGKLPGRIILREHESDEEKAKAPQLPDDYYSLASATAQKQAALAGHRLAMLLKIVAAVPEPKP